jgi:glycosyltransferase involved in cell wall biosynthesis
MASKYALWHLILVTEVIGRGGILVKHLDQYGFAKAMGKLAGSAKLRAELGKQALLQSKKYQINIHLKRLLKLYSELITDLART